MDNNRTLFVTLLTIVLSSSSPPLTRTQRVGQSISTDQQPVSSTASQPDSVAVAKDAQQLRDVLGTVNDILFRGTGLPRIRESTADGALIEGFDADSVIRIIKEGKESLNSGLKKKEFAGLTAYVDRFYKIPTLETLERVGRTKDGQTLITPRSKAAAFENPRQVVENIQSVANESRLSINLRVNSQPEENATYEMWPDKGERWKTVTNNTVNGVYRGYYNYRVTKPGYKTIEDRLNLVDGDGRILDCQIYKTKDKDGPHPCKHH